MKNEKNCENTLGKLDLDHFLQKIDSLTPQERLELGQKLLNRLLGKSGLTVVLSGNNVINNSFVVQLNDDNMSSEVERQLTDIPNETLGKLVEAIANKIDADSKQ